MKHGTRSLQLAFFSTALVACTQRPPAPDVSYNDVAIANDADGGTVTDSPIAIDSVGSDVTDVIDGSVAPDAADSTTPDGDASVAPADVAPLPDPCASASIIDLSAVGNQVGPTTTYSGTTAGLPMASAIPGVCVFTVGYEVALRYTTSSNAHLRISTANPGTPATFDTVVWLLDHCDAAGSSLGCADDSVPGDRRSTFTTTGAVAAGTQVFIIVAGFTPPHPGFVETGAFELSVTEVPESAAGMACDPAGLTSVCQADAHCLSDTTPATCIQDGSPGGRCRPVFPGCNTGYGCNGDRLSETTRCLPQIPSGGSCDPSMQMNVCPPGLICVDIGAGPRCH